MRSRPAGSLSRRAFSCLLHSCISSCISDLAFLYSSFQLSNASKHSSSDSKTPSKYFWPKESIATDLYNSASSGDNEDFHASKSSLKPRMVVRPCALLVAAGEETKESDRNSSRHAA